MPDPGHDEPYKAKNIENCRVPDDYYSLSIKRGAHVMFVQNKEDEYVNGTMGVVTNYDDDHIWVRIKGEDKVVCTERATFYTNDYNYDCDNDCIEEYHTGKFRQFPLILAWAITVHKSQGQTFSTAILDLEKSFT